MKKQYLFNDIEAAFNRAVKGGYYKRKKETEDKEQGKSTKKGGKKKKKELDSGPETYIRRIKTFINSKIEEKVSESNNPKFMNPRFWKGEWMDEYIDELIDRYHNDELSAIYIENTIHAIHKLNDLLEKDPFLGKGFKHIRLGTKGSINSGKGQLNYLHQEGVIDSKDHVTSIKPKGHELELVKDAIPVSNRNYETIIKVLEAQAHTGGRIKAELRLKSGDIDYENQVKKYVQDKNKFNRNTPINATDIRFYQKLEEGKPKGSPLFPVFDQNGKEMSPAKASKYIQEVLHRAAEAAGVNRIESIIKKDRNGNDREVEVKMRFTSHSNRRGYGQEVYNSTRYWNKKRIERETARYLNLQGSNKEKILTRMQKELERVNRYNIKYGKPRRDFTWEEKRRLYVSLLLGHSRLNILSRYVDLDAPIYKQKSKKKV